MNIAIRNHQLNPPKPWDLRIKDRSFYIAGVSYTAQADEVRRLQEANGVYTDENDLSRLLNTQWCNDRPELCKPVSEAPSIVRTDSGAKKRTSTRSGGGCSVCGGGRKR